MNWKFTSLKYRILILIIVLIYKFFLELAYYYSISPDWSYMGLYLKLNPVKLFESYILLCFTFLILFRVTERLSFIVLYAIFLLSYIPILSIYAMKDEARAFVYGVTFFWILASLFYTLPYFRINFLKDSQSKSILYFIALSLILISLFLVYKYLGFSVNLNLAIVYEIRERYVEARIPYAGYILNWTAYIIIPTIFAVSLKKRNRITLLLSIFSSLILFSVTGLKAFLFAIPFLILIIWMIKKNFFFYFPLSLIFMIISGIISRLVLNDIWISSLFTRRLLFVPALLSFYYHDFFSKSGPLFLSHHRIFSLFLKYPYDLNPPHLIGMVYFNSPEMGANNGIFGDAFMNFGYIGFLLWAFVFVLLLKLVDSFSRDKDKILTVAPLVLPILSLVNSALLTCLLTHGFILSLVVLYLLPKDNFKRGKILNDS